MITLIEQGQKPVMQGNTTLARDKTLEYKSRKGIDLCCSNCSNPFILSLQKFGAINETVVCNVCKEEICFIVDK